jgi:uncharacterized membrane protein
MNFEIGKLFLSSSIYSFTPLFEKIILRTLAKDVYLLVKYTIRFFGVIGYNVVMNNNVPLIENMDKIRKVFIYLVGAAVIAFSSQYLYLDALKNMDISLVEPIGNVMINVFSVAIGALFLKEELTMKKIAGVAVGGISIALLTG